MKLGREEKPRNLACWEKDANAQCLRVELSEGGLYIFPYHRLQFVRLEHATTQDQLRLMMDTHEVCITGKNLRDLGAAFQKLGVEWVRELPARYAATASHDDAYISSIKVNELQAQERRLDGLERQ